MKSTPPCICRRHFSGTLFKAATGLTLAGWLGGARAQEGSGAATGAAHDAGAIHQPKSMRSKALETGANILQSHAPVDAMSAYLNGFHFYADDMGRQVEAHHYCTHLSEDFHQCVIFDSNEPGAKLIGIEYIVSERVFKSLPDDEKRLWHSHHYEVKSGELAAPGIPDIAEQALMKDLVTTYGKTWHTWQIDRDKALPLGIPQLMMGFTQDGQLDGALVQDRDARLGVSAAEDRQKRADIPMPAVVPGANSWESGTSLQLQLVEVPLRNRRP